MLGPKIATTGVPTAVATWTDPPSLATTRRQRRISAPSACGLGAGGATRAAGPMPRGDLPGQRLLVRVEAAQHQRRQAVPFEERLAHLDEALGRPSAARD